MIEVNLLPKAKKSGPKGGLRMHWREHTPKRLPSGWWLGAGAVALASVVLMARLLLTVERRISSLEATLVTLRQDSVRVEEARGQRENQLARRDSIANKTAAIEKIDAERQLWPRIMDELARMLPAEAWLTRVETVPVDGTVRFRVEGKAQHYAAITRVWNALEGSPVVYNVRLVSTQAALQDPENESNEGWTAYDFVLEADYEEATNSQPKNGQSE